MRKQPQEEQQPSTSKDIPNINLLSESTFKRERGDLCYYNEAIDPKTLVYKIYYEEYKREDLDMFMDIAFKKVREDTFYKYLKQESARFVKIMRDILRKKHERAIERYAAGFNSRFNNDRFHDLFRRQPFMYSSLVESLCQCLKLIETITVELSRLVQDLLREDQQAIKDDEVEPELRNQFFKEVYNDKYIYGFLRQMEELFRTVTTYPKLYSQTLFQLQEFVQGCDAM